MINLTQEQQERAEKIRWFQMLDLKGYVTNGQVPYCNEYDATHRFGVPLDLKNKTVLDVGCNSGYFSFLAERRGAEVTGIDPVQDGGDAAKGFLLAKEVYESNVKFHELTLSEFVNKYPKEKFDITFYYGVLYHVTNPLGELQLLSDVTKEYTIIETAIASSNYDGKSVWEYKHGFLTDKTNYWYPTLIGLENMLYTVGFTKVELVTNFHDIRATIKAYK